MLAPATPFLTRPPAVRIGGTLRDAPQCGTIKSQADAAKISNVHFTCALHGLGQGVGGQWRTNMPVDLCIALPDNPNGLEDFVASVGG